MGYILTIPLLGQFFVSERESMHKEKVGEDYNDAYPLMLPVIPKHVPRVLAPPPMWVAGKVPPSLPVIHMSRWGGGGSSDSGNEVAEIP